MKGFLLLCTLFAACLSQNYNSCPGQLSTLGWCDCSSPNSGITVQNFFFSPNPPKLGQNVSGAITATDNYQTPITDGSVNVLVQYLGVTLLNQTSDLCQLLQQAPFPGVPQCPVPPQKLKTVTFNENIPNVVPPGSYTGQVMATDQTGRIIHCVQFNLTLS